MDLVDTVASNTTATSPVELSLNPAFRREHHSVFDAIKNFFQPTSAPKSQERPAAADSPKAQRIEQEKEMTRLITSTIPPLENRSYHLTALDVTPIPRPFAHTLKDRGFIHSPNPVANNRPVSIGHACSMLTYLPEKITPTDPKWLVPLSARRVDSNSLETVVGADQLKTLMDNTELPFHGDLIVNVADSKYSARNHVAKTAGIEHLVDIVRSAGNRTFYQSPPPIPDGQTRPANHPTWYGDKFSMQDPTTWHTPTQTAQLTIITKKEKKQTLTIQCWDGMLMKDKDGMVMHVHPFRLVRVTGVDDKGNPVYKRPLWLLVFGKRRGELALNEIVKAFMQRYDIEHFFRFGKQKLLMTAAQTPDVEAEENWWQIMILAYVQLWVARELAQQTPRPWEKKPESEASTIASPSAVQRDFSRLTQQFGTPAKSPKPRGYSSGRQKGDKQTPRPRQAVIKKTKRSPSPP